MVGHGGSSAGLYLANPTSPIPSHCAVIILFKSLLVHQFVVTSTLRVNLYNLYVNCAFTITYNLTWTTDTKPRQRSSYLPVINSVRQVIKPTSLHGHLCMLTSSSSLRPSMMSLSSMAPFTSCLLAKLK